jgi:hypothetical protein
MKNECSHIFGRGRKRSRRLLVRGFAGRIIKRGGETWMLKGVMRMNILIAITATSESWAVGYLKMVRGKIFTGVGIVLEKLKSVNYASGGRY